MTFADLETGDGKTKPGYDKIRFCGDQARHDGLQYSRINTCCIDKGNKAELAFAIRSMFRWYRNAARCYVYLSDISSQPLVTDRGHSDVVCSQQRPGFTLQKSRWFTRGWTLQELIAPCRVDFFSKEGIKLGDKLSLAKKCMNTLASLVQRCKANLYLTLIAFSN